MSTRTEHVPGLRHALTIAKFLIPDHPQQDNYLDPNEWEEKEKEWEEKWDLALV